MFVCKYCGTEFTEHRSNCPNCGAPIKVTQTAKIGDRSIREICLKFDDVSSLFIDEAIDKKRMTTVRGNFDIPENEKVIMVYDDTIFGNNKVGFAICANGLYWSNDWSVETKRNKIAWDEFAAREIKLEQYRISLGRGDNLGVAGCGSDEIRWSIVKMLQEIKLLLSGV